MLNLAHRLREAGLLGLNQRNGDYTLQYNERRNFPLVDDKLKTKMLAEKAGIAVTELYGVVEVPHQVKELHSFLLNYQDFVIKPAHGSGGEGIVVIAGRSKGLYRQINGTLLTPEELSHHVFNILSGMYSLGGQPDVAIIEYRVQFDPIFEPISYQGVPDIRIIVFLGVPVMSMVRLPTRLSDGKANLHQGAIGVGIDMRSGKTLAGVWKNQVIQEHPDTGNVVNGVQIPGWHSLLLLAARCHELSGLGYQGVDIVLDRTLGPLILELNARPGLNIQIANGAGLLPRLKLVEDHISELRDVVAKVRFAEEHFGV